jgi:redox-sensitive bicupin YhaK (pirin superfamily)
MIEIVISQRRRDLGGFEVGRVLPFAKRRMVGPFVFFDHMGPVDFPAGLPRSVDVRPHPHIGLATLTYLFDGEIMHRDSVGSEQPIRPGEVNWMTAGRGITHSERFERARREGGRMDGIQAWVALPREVEETDPAFSHHRAIRLDERLRLIAGEAFGEKSPVPVYSPLFYVRRGRGRGPALRSRPDGGLRRRRRLADPGHQPRRRHAPRWRAARAALHRVELRFLLARAHRAGKGRLARRPHEAAGSR